MPDRQELGAGLRRGGSASRRWRLPVVQVLPLPGPPAPGRGGAPHRTNLNVVSSVMGLVVGTPPPEGDGRAHKSKCADLGVCAS